VGHGRSRVLIQKQPALEAGGAPVRGGMGEALPGFPKKAEARLRFPEMDRGGTFEVKASAAVLKTDGPRYELLAVG